MTCHAVAVRSPRVQYFHWSDVFQSIREGRRIDVESAHRSLLRNPLHSHRRCITPNAPRNCRAQESGSRRRLARWSIVILIFAMMFAIFWFFLTFSHGSRLLKRFQRSEFLKTSSRYKCTIRRSGTKASQPAWKKPRRRSAVRRKRRPIFEEILLGSPSSTRQAPMRRINFGNWF